jgi:hypothetical protein
VSKDDGDKLRVAVVDIVTVFVCGPSVSDKVAERVSRRSGDKVIWTDGVEELDLVCVLDIVPDFVVLPDWVRGDVKDDVFEAVTVSLRDRISLTDFVEDFTEVPVDEADGDDD